MEWGASLLSSLGTAVARTAAAARDSINNLLEQKQAQQEARREEQKAARLVNNRLPDNANGPLGRGGLENNAAVLGGAATGAGVRGGMPTTKDLPPLLMRRYELRVLPLHHPGSFP